jgi:CDP-glucose 4,6-dehydratase
MFRGLFEKKKVWLSGHTGFKGSWLAGWLLELGAYVHGFALVPSTNPSLFDQLCLQGRMHHEIGDIRDADAVAKSIQSASPDFVFHLAAQPLVRLSYQEPVATFATNVMGTVHVLEALQARSQPCAAIFVTTDKCYHNREWLYAYREEDRLGGHDPYSSSKAAAEIAIAAYRKSFFGSDGNATIRIASARAGNVIGGGDWALDRIVPDAVRALTRNEQIPLRNKQATRPWQHVLEPLSGYLWLAAVLADPSLRSGTNAADLADAFNFGPDLSSNRTVEKLIEEVLKHWPGNWVDRHDPKAVHEASLLNLSTDKAHHLLGWRAVWNFEETVAETVGWYKKVVSGGNPADLAVAQIQAYSERARTLGVEWADRCS